MASQTNSVRLQRLANTMEMRSIRSTSFFESSGEMVKLPALRAINKSVKYNDLSYATSRDLKKLHKQPEMPENIEEMSAHHNLVTLRKKYDNMNKNREALQRQVDIRQKEHDKLEAEKNKFEGDKLNGGARVAALSSDLQAIKLQLEQTETERKVLLNMVGRLKSDRVVYDLRKFNFDKELHHLYRQQEIIEKEYDKQKGEDDRTEKFKTKFVSHLSAENIERSNHMNIVQGMVGEKVELLQKNHRRAQQMQQISQLTLQDKDYKQKNWYKVYLCNRFVERILRDKMTREMMKFNTVEVAFKNIKTATGVNNSQLLIKKFLNKEAAYGQLLGKIADNQRVIVDLKAEGEELKKERRKLETEQEHLNADKKEMKDLSREEKEYQLIGEKQTLCHEYQQNLKYWLTKTLTKFALTDKKSNDQAQQNEGNTNIVDLFKSFLGAVADSIQKIDIVEENSKEIVPVIHQKNYRIDLEGKAQQQEDKIALKMKNARLNEEEDHINLQRHQVIRNNDKFMKQLKKRSQDLKKAQIQAQPKKREVVVQKPKPPPLEA